MTPRLPLICKERVFQQLEACLNMFFPARNISQTNSQQLSAIITSFGLPRFAMAIVAVMLVQEPAVAQKAAQPLYQPETWHEVRFDHEHNRFRDKSGGTLNEEYWLHPMSRNVTESFWRVFVDRAGVQLREKPAGDGARIGSALPFGQALYVFKVDGEWLQVGTDMKTLGGWCSKRDLVLWSRPLMDHRTGIELKALLVNRMKDVMQSIELLKGDKKEKYIAFNGPSHTAQVVKEDYLYDVLYIYKYDDTDKQAGPRWLVGLHPELGSLTPLMGWVSKSKVQVWNTRLCLEPNFDESAMADRREKGIRAKVFEFNDVAGQRTYLSTGMGKGLMDNNERDPAFNDDPLRSPRMDGRLFRYPVLNAKFESGQSNCSFKTGASGRWTHGSTGLNEGFNDDEFLSASRALRALKDRKGSVNVVFVVEGSKGTKEHLDAAKGSIAAMHRQFRESHNLRYGIVYYRNERKALDKVKNPESEYIEGLDLTGNVEQVLNWLNSRVPRDDGDLNQARAAYFALKRGIDMLQQFETNIIVHICRRPDNSAFIPMFKGKTAIDATDLGAGMKLGYATHYLAYVTKGQSDALDEGVRREAYENLAADVMQNLTDAISNAMKGVVDLGMEASGAGKAQAAQVDATRLPDGTEQTRMSKQHFVMLAKLLKSPLPNLHETITQDLASCLTQNDKMLAAVENVVEDNSFVKDLASNITYLTSEMIAFESKKADEISRYLAANKVHTFIDAWTYYKVANLKEPLFRYVLFMDEERIKDEVAALRSLLLALEKGNATESQKELLSIWKAHAEATMGSRYDSRVDLLTIRAKLMGINELEMVRPFEEGSVLKGLRLEDLQNERTFKNTDFTKYQELVKANLNKLSSMQTSSNYYIVPGHEQRKYFWVPIEFLLN